MLKCFESQKAFDDWQALVEASGSTKSASPCRDCTQARKDQMVAADRCRYPETVFVLVRGEHVGLNGTDPGWYGAVTGQYAGTTKQSGLPFVAPCRADTTTRGANGEQTS